MLQKVFKQKLFYSGCKKFWAAQRYFAIVTKLNKMNVKKKAKSISTTDFSKLYTTIPHKVLLKVLSEVINFVFKFKSRKRIGFSKTSTYWISKGAGRRHFTKQTLVNTMPFFINVSSLLVAWFLNKILVYQQVLIQYHFGPTSLFIYLNLSI